MIFFSTLTKNLLSSKGIAIIGTPNKYAEAYQSEASKMAHVNMFDANRLRSALLNYFHNVFVFSMNDEVVHTGFDKMSHYLLALCVTKKSS